MAFTAADARSRHQSLTDTEATLWMETANASLNRSLSDQAETQAATKKAVTDADAALKKSRDVKAEQFVGYESFDGMTISENAGLITGVKVAGAKSRNGYVYQQEALRDAVTLYESQPVFLDHSPTPGKPFNRSARDLAGYVKNPRFTNEGIFADIDTLETEAGQTLRGLVKAQGSKAGMSHVVLARRQNGEVTKIEEVISVDAVAFPATTKTFYEAIQSPEPTIEPLSDKEEEMDLSKLTIEEIKSGRPDLVENLLSEKKIDEDSKQLKKQLEESRKELKVLQQEKARLELTKSIGKELQDSGLDTSSDKVVSETFMNQLLACESMEARKILIDDRKSILGAAGKLQAIPKSSTPGSSTGNLSEAMGMTAQEVIASIRS